MDNNFSYKYEETLNSGSNNRLSWVDDLAGASYSVEQSLDIKSSSDILVQTDLIINVYISTGSIAVTNEQIDRVLHQGVLMGDINSSFSLSGHGYALISFKVSMGSQKLNNFLKQINY